MNTLEASLLATELASARTNATLGASHVDQVRRVAQIDAHNAGLKISPLHLAKYHFDEAAKLIDQALGKTPTPIAPSIDEMITLAKARSEVGKVGIAAPRDPLPENNGSSVTLARLPGEGSAQDASAASGNESLHPTISTPEENAQ